MSRSEPTPARAGTSGAAPTPTPDRPTAPAGPPAPAEPPAPGRADARRNRDKLLAAAQAAFAAAEGPVSLEAIARRAGVGIGTLYRHFPTREALVDAVYASELDDVTATVGVLLDRFPPDVALRAWMDRYATFVATKHGMMDTLRAGIASGRFTPTTRARIVAAISEFLGRGAEAGSLRADTDPEDVVAMLLGVFLSTSPGATSEQTGRLLDLIVDALRPRDHREGQSPHPGPEPRRR